LNALSLRTTQNIICFIQRVCQIEPAVALLLPQSLLLDITPVTFTSTFTLTFTITFTFTFTRTTA
jgi:hypothetical protein